MKIYIYWEAQVSFISFKDAQEYYEDNCDPTTFNDFLTDNYGSEEIFYFTEDERIKVIEDYKNSLIEEVENWLNFNCDIIEIEGECKINKKIAYMY